MPSTEEPHDTSRAVPPTRRFDPLTSSTPAQAQQPTAAPTPVKAPCGPARRDAAMEAPGPSREQAFLSDLFAEFNALPPGG